MLQLISLFLLQNTFGPPWDSLGLLGALWELLGAPLGRPWDPLGPLWSPWDPFGPLGSLGSPWVPLAPLGPLPWALWVPLGPLGGLGWGWGPWGAFGSKGSAPCRSEKRASRTLGGGADSAGENILGRRHARKRIWIWGCFLDDLRMFSGWFWNVFWMFLGCFLNDLGMFSGCVGDVFWMSSG